MFPILLVVFFYCLKVYMIGRSFYIDDNDSYLRVAGYDALYILPIIIILMITSSTNRFWFIIGRITTLLLILIYITDCYLIFTYQSRLYLEDIPKFYDQVIIYLGEISIKQIIYILFSVSLCSVYIFSRRLAIQKLIITIIVIAYFFSFSSLLWEPVTVRQPFYINVIQANFNSTHLNEYSNKFKSEFNYSPIKTCHTNNSIQPEKIVVIMFESWSSYHSRYFGHGNNWTPKLDEIARNNITLENFYANGFTTEAGLYALFTGQPLLSGSISMKLDGGIGLSDLETPNSLIKSFVSAGYNTSFITSGDLSFLDKDQWLKSLGFHKTIGANNYSELLPRFLFRSVSDEVLFNRAYKEIMLQKGKQLVVVENVTTHQPFIVPKDKGYIQSESVAFKYADNVIAEFIHRIVADNTLVIVLSDHRAMTPLTQSEQRRYGQMASSKVPAFIIWQGMQKSIRQLTQQSDVLASLFGTLEGKSCVSELNGQIFPLNKVVPPQCVVFRRGDRRDKVTLRCRDNDYNVLLDGDQTRLVNGDIRHITVNMVNYLRLHQQ